MTYDQWKTTEPDRDEPNRTAIDDEREELYAEIEKLRATNADLLSAAKALLRFNEELCEDGHVSKHYPSAEKARAAIARAEDHS